MRKDAGVTVLELLTVIAIAGVLAAIAVPNFLSYQYNSRLKGALSTLRGDLVGARMLAIKRGVEYQVVFTASDYKIQRGNKSSNADVWSDEFTRDFSEYGGVSVDTDETGNPVFSPKGTVAAAPVIITLQNAQRTRTITIHMAGKIKEN